VSRSSRPGSSQPPLNFTLSNLSARAFLAAALRTTPLVYYFDMPSGFCRPSSTPLPHDQAFEPKARADPTPSSGPYHDVPLRSFGDWDLLTTHQLEFAPIKIAKWQNRRSGLSVVWANSPGPLVRMWATVVTEIHNDSGIPHTLEHLTFMGSEK
jgi:hypothetical protein